MTLSLSFHEAKVSTRPTVSPLQYGNSEILQLPVRVWKYKAAILKRTWNKLITYYTFVVVVASYAFAKCPFIQFLIKIS